MKIDLHVHTKYSEDAINSPEWIMRMLKKRKLNGLAVTDHNSVRGWKSTQEAAKKLGLVLILGEEIKVYHNRHLSGEVLALFLNEEIRPGEPPDVIDRVRQQDGIVVVAHPFDSKKGFRNLESFRGKVDAVEAYNSSLPSSVINDVAFRFAERTGLGMTGGSDAHVPWEVGLAFTIAEASDLEEFRRALEGRKTSFSGRMNFPPMHFFSVSMLTLKKVGNLFR